MPLNQQKAAVARALVGARYPGAQPDDNIRKTLDEPVEQFATAHFYNGPAAEWVTAKTPFAWIILDPPSLDKVKTIRDLGKLCYAHLTDKPAIKRSSVEVFK